MNPDAGTRLGFYCWLLPTVTVTICATWSMQTELAPACFPFIEGCASISAVCRPVPVVYLFRSMMLPVCVLLLVFWWCHHHWLMQYTDGHARLCRLILALSLFGSVFLVLYVVFLGTDGPMYAFLRRLGVYVFFGCTGVAQLLTSWTLRRSRITSGHRPDEPPVWPLALTMQWVMVVFMLTMGPLNLLLKAVLTEPDRMENVIEWHFALVMFAWYALQGHLMKQHPNQL